MSTIKENALLVNLKLSQWTGRKFDRQATDEVDQNHGTSGAGRFNKILVNKNRIGEIATAAHHLRKFHYHNTLPWSDNGDRIIPVTNYFDYIQGSNDLISKFNDKVREFIKDYDDLKNEARQRLNGLFADNDYPSINELKEKYGAKVEFNMIPNVSDFRINLTSDEEVNKLRQEIESSIKDRHESAIQDLVERSKDAVLKIVSALNRLDENEKARFHDALMDNLKSVVDVIPKLNYTNNAKIDRMQKELAKLVTDTGTLKSDPDVREKYLERATLLDEMFF